MLKESIFKELIKKGYSKEDEGRVWDITNQNLLFSSPEISSAFLEVRSFPTYRSNVVNRELNLIKESKADLMRSIGNESFNLVDMGFSIGERAIEFAKLFPKSKIRYCPISPNLILTEIAVQNVKKTKLKNIVAYSPEKSDFEDFEEASAMLRNAEFQKNVILLMGNTLATFEINDFLFNLSNAMFKGDVLVIGNGIREGKRLVNIDLYRNKIFDKWFSHLVKSLGFDDKEVFYDARFGNSRIECFYKLLTDKGIEHNGKKINFKKGDKIVAVAIYKYFAQELEKFCKMYFSEGQFLKDEHNEHALIICKK